MHPHSFERGRPPSRGKSAGATILPLAPKPSHIEPEIDDVAVLHDVVFPLGADLPARLECGFASSFFQLVQSVDLGADEAALDVAVHLASRLSGHRSLPDRPGAAFVGAGGEKADQIEEPVSGTNEHVSRGLADAEPHEKFFLL